MYRLYGAPGKASAAPEAVLEVLELEYDYVELSPQNARADEDYRKLNPLGQIPTLIDGETVVWEAAAICLYLADKHPDGNLAPMEGDARRGHLYQWMFFLSNSLQPAYMQYYYPERYCEGTTAADALRRNAGARVASLWSVIEQSITTGPFLLDESFTVGDIYLFMLSTWHRVDTIQLSSLEKVSRLVALAARRPGIEQMMLRNGD